MSDPSMNDPAMHDPAMNDPAMHPSNSATESFASQGMAPAAMSATRPLYWSVRRELWENRSLYIAPLVVSAVILFGFTISSIHRPVSGAMDRAKLQGMLAAPYDWAAALIMATTVIVAIFYCLEALHGERRDRSILFWKSLPVSDLTTVLSKASIPLVAVPAITFATIVGTQTIMLLMNSATRLASGGSAAELWREVPLFRMSMGLLYHLVTVHSLWYAPIFAWLLLVSSWARRATFLWATLPWFAVWIVEKVVFDTSYFVSLLGQRLGGPTPYDVSARGGGAMSSMGTLDPGEFLRAPGLWIGLGIAAVLLAAAARLRRHQGPI